MRRKKTKKGGLSLIEMIIVIAILGLLSILTVTNIVTQMQRARDARRKIDFNNIQKSLEQYYDSAKCYPVELPECGNALNITSTIYLAEMPCDPKLKSDYAYIADSGICTSWFTLYTNLERIDDISIDLVGCRNGCGPQCQYNFGIASPNTSLERCTPTPTPTPIYNPTPTPIQYVCAPASGPKPLGSCEAYAVPTLSLCPKIYPGDPTCNFECGNRDNRCQNARGKNKPEY